MGLLGAKLIRAQHLSGSGSLDFVTLYVLRYTYSFISPSYTQGEVTSQTLWLKRSSFCGYKMT